MTRCYSRKFAKQLKFTAEPVVIDDENEEIITALDSEVCFYSPELAALMNAGGLDAVTSVVTILADGSIEHEDGMGNVTSFQQGSTFTLDAGNLEIESPDGSLIVIPAVAATLVVNPDGTVDYTASDGTVTSFNTGWTQANVIGSDLILTYPDGLTTTVPIPTSVLTVNADGTITHSDGAGNDVTFKQGSDFELVDKTLTITQPDGSDIVLTASDITKTAPSGDPLLPAGPDTITDMDGDQMCGGYDSVSYVDDAETTNNSHLVAEVLGIDGKVAGYRRVLEHDTFAAHVLNKTIVDVAEATHPAGQIFSRASLVFTNTTGRYLSYKVDIHSGGIEVINDVNVGGPPTRINMHYRVNGGAWEQFPAQGLITFPTNELTHVAFAGDSCTLTSGVLLIGGTVEIEIGYSVVTYSGSELITRIDGGSIGIIAGTKG